MEVIHQLISRGYSLHGDPLERPLPAGQQEATAMVYHLSRDEAVDQGEAKTSIADEDDCQMKECKVNDKSDSLSLIQVVIKKGLK